MNHGLPIIGSNVSGIPEGVKQNVNGWLVPPADTSQLATVMEESMVTDRLFDMKKASRKIAIDHFSLENNIRALKNLMLKHKQTEIGEEGK